MLGVQSDALLVGLMVWMGILRGEISAQGNVHYCTDSSRCPCVFDALTLLFNRKSPGNFNNTLLTVITITHSLFDKDSLQHKYLSFVALMRHVRFAWDKHACFHQFGSCMRYQNCFQDKKWGRNNEETCFCVDLLHNNARGQRETLRDSKWMWFYNISHV